MAMGDNGIDDYKKMQANWWRYWSPCRRGNTTKCAFPDGAHPWLHTKPLDAAIGQVTAPYCHGSYHGWQFWMKPKNANKTQLLPSFLTVDQHKQAKQFWDPKQTLYSHHWCNKLRTNKKPHYSSWRAQLHFELSNVVNGQKFKKLLTLNEAQENLWAIYGPIVIKLLIVHWARCIPVWIIDPMSSALLGCAMIWSNAARSDGTACFKLAFPFTMYSLKYSSADSLDVVLVMGEKLFAQSTILVIIMLFSQ